MHRDSQGSALKPCLIQVVIPAIDTPSSLLTLGVLQYLQQACEFAVSKIDKRGPAPPLLTQSVDAVAQSQQRAVDVGSFLHPLALVPSRGGEERGSGTGRQSTRFRMVGLCLGKMCGITGSRFG